MAPLVPFLLFCQALGASIGAFTAVWSELAYLRAMRDGVLDAAERAYIRVIHRGLSFGMTLLLLSSFGIVVADYALRLSPQPALLASYWITVIFALLIVGVSWALARRRVSFAFGSAVIFTAWWFLAYLSFGLFPPLSFGSAVALLVLATAVFYALLQYSRFLALQKK